jgi:hypothetical protein
MTSPPLHQVYVVYFTAFCMYRAGISPKQAGAS